MARIGFVLAKTPLESPGAHTLYHLAVGALARGHEVWAYCHQEGVYQLLRNQHLPDPEEGSPSGWWQALLARGVHVVVNELCARSRGVDGKDFLLEGITLGNPGDLAQLVERSDQVVCL
jgi:sulfur relay (sulfurtransferase) complex TusBCD TusD component (DsrE family)